MQKISLPNALDAKDWVTKVTPAVDKPTKISTSIGAISSAFDKVKVKLFDFSTLKTASEANARIKEIEDEINKPLQAIVGSLKKLEADVKGANDALKKAGKDAHGKALLSAIASFSNDAKAVPQAALDELRTVIKGLEAAEAKKAPAAADPKDKKDDAADQKAVLDHNRKVKQWVRAIGTGKHQADGLPFCFAQNKVNKAYSKGKPWEHKSLAHVGPKAVKSFQSQFNKLMGDEGFAFRFGTVRAATNAQGKVVARKLVIDFDSSLANPKQLKDAFMFQIGYAPALVFSKGGKIEAEEAGEGDDDGEVLGDAAEDEAEEEGGAGLTLSSAQKKILDDAIALPGDAAKVIKRKIDEAQALAKSAAGAAKAKALVAEAETVAKALLLKASESAKAGAAGPAGVAADVVARIRKASESWTASSAAAEKGIDQVMLALNKMFDGDAVQAPKVKDALRTLNNLKPKLKSDLAKKLEEATKEVNESRRSNLIREAITAATQIEKRIADDPLMGELDGANNDVLPGVNIIGPMKSALGAIRALA